MLVAVLLKYELHVFFRNFNGDRPHRPGIDVEAHEEDTSSVNHKCQDSAVKRKLRDIQVNTCSRSERFPMIRSEAWLQVLSVMNKQTGTIWRQEYRDGQRLKVK